MRFLKVLSVLVFSALGAITGNLLSGFIQDDLWNHFFSQSRLVYTVAGFFIALIAGAWIESRSASGNPQANNASSPSSQTRITPNAGVAEPQRPSVSAVESHGTAQAPTVLSNEHMSQADSPRWWQLLELLKNEKASSEVYLQYTSRGGMNRYRVDLFQIVASSEYQVNHAQRIVRIVLPRALAWRDLNNQAAIHRVIAEIMIYAGRVFHGYDIEWEIASGASYEYTSSYAPLQLIGFTKL